MPPFKGNLEQNTLWAFPCLCEETECETDHRIISNKTKDCEHGRGAEGGLRLKGTATNTLLLKGYFQTSYACFRLDRAIDG